MAPSIKRKLSKLLHPRLVILYLLESGLAKRMPDALYLKIQYYLTIGKRLDLAHPRGFNEKLQWLKLHDRDPRYVAVVDKYEAKTYISETVGEGYAVPALGVWERWEDIDFAALPEKFVLKCTHDSGSTVLCGGKAAWDARAAEKKIGRCLKRNYYYENREWPYKMISPRILCEMLLEDDAGREIVDYKFMCFNGQVKCAFVCLNRNSPGGLNVIFYDTGWNRMPFERHYPSGNLAVAKPKNYDLMVELAEKLARGMPFARVDFYEVNEKVYVGEITLYPGGGVEEFTPERYDRVLGDWLRLPAEGASHA